MKMMSGAAMVVQTLNDLGVKHVFDTLVPY